MAARRQILEAAPGGGTPRMWGFGWATVHFSATGITIEQSPDNGITWTAALRLDGAGGPATSGAVEFMMVNLAHGLPTRATGTGQAILVPGSAPNYAFQSEIPAA